MTGIDHISYNDGMHYRRNADSPNRDLYRLAAQGNLQAKEKLFQVMFRAGQIPIIPTRHGGIPQLQPYLQRIDVRYWSKYLDLINQLIDASITFEMQPNNSCNCENQADCVVHPSLTCHYCQTESLQIFPGKISPAQPEFGEAGGYPVTRCGNPRCNREYLIQQWVNDGFSIEVARLHFPVERELNIGRCDGFPWRAYEHALGGLCDDCISRYPLSYHASYCQCERCGEGVGPLIFLASSRLLETDQLNLMLRDYRYLFDDGRTVQVPFTIDHDEDYSQDWWRQPLENSLLALDQRGECYIEIRPNGKYRLRTSRHQNEKDLLPVYKQILDRRRQFAQFNRMLGEYTPGQDMFEYHMVGWDFELSDLIRHLQKQFRADVMH